MTTTTISDSIQDLLSSMGGLALSEEKVVITDDVVNTHLDKITEEPVSEPSNTNNSESNKLDQLDELTDLFDKKLAITEEPSRTEVQSHGFTWEKEICMNVYRALDEEYSSINYTSKMDLPAKFNHLDHCNLSIKTTKTPNSVCMADCLRIFDCVSSEDPFHLVVIHYDQINPTTKRVTGIMEVDLTSSRELLFGNITRSQIEELITAVRAVPQKRKPTKDERAHMYDIRDKLHEIKGVIHLDIKCNSTQSRLQCSFNEFQKFIEENPSRVIAKSDTNEFRGGNISSLIHSPPRQFSKKKSLSHTPSVKDTPTKEEPPKEEIEKNKEEEKEEPPKEEIEKNKEEEEKEEEKEVTTEEVKNE